jgi:hypothetical protein
MLLARVSGRFLRVPSGLQEWDSPYCFLPRGRSTTNRWQLLLHPSRHCLTQTVCPKEGKRNAAIAPVHSEGNCALPDWPVEVTETPGEDSPDDGPKPNAKGASDDSKRRSGPEGSPREEAGRECPRSELSDGSLKESLTAGMGALSRVIRGHQCRGNEPDGAAMSALVWSSSHSQNRGFARRNRTSRYCVGFSGPAEWRNRECSTSSSTFPQWHRKGG